MSILPKATDRPPAKLGSLVRLRNVGGAPLDDALDAVLAGPPVWVANDPLPDTGDNVTNCGRWDIDQPLLKAWCSRDAEIVALAKPRPTRPQGSDNRCNSLSSIADAAVLAVYRVRPVKDYFIMRRLVRWPGDLVRLKGPRRGVK